MQRSTRLAARVSRCALVAVTMVLSACADQPSPTAPATPLTLSPIVVARSSGFTQVDAGAISTCALTSGGAVHCWGKDADGVLPITVPAAAGSGIVQVSNRGYTTCALSSAGAVTCWGENNVGQSTVPAAAQSGIAEVSAGSYGTCAVTTAGGVICWGTYPSSGQSDVPAVAQSGIAHVSAGGFHTCAVGTAGALTCWGLNILGEISVPAGSQSGMAQVSAGFYHTCALSIAGAVTCWGNNHEGQTNVPVAALSGIAQVATSDTHACALSTAGAVICWGSSYVGDPVTVPAAAQSGIVQISAGRFHTCALNTAGGIVCWGDNTYGQTTTHVLPTATFSAPTTSMFLGQSFALTLTNAQVPGYPSATGFTYAFDCGTGAYASASATANRSCSATTPGSLAVRGKIIDSDGDTNEYTTTVAVMTVAQAIDALKDEVEASDLAKGKEKELVKKLAEALKIIDQGKKKTPCNALADFVKKVKEQRGKAIPAATADGWLAQADAIRDAADCEDKKH